VQKYSDPEPKKQNIQWKWRQKCESMIVWLCDCVCVWLCMFEKVCERDDCKQVVLLTWIQSMNLETHQ
jgi:hypothetical protein